MFETYMAMLNPAVWCNTIGVQTLMVLMVSLTAQPGHDSRHLPTLAGSDDGLSRYAGSHPLSSCLHFAARQMQMRKHLCFQWVRVHH